MPEYDPTKVAILFHKHYERLAPFYNYQTREDTSVKWENLPQENKSLMVSTCYEVLADLGLITRPN